METESKYQNYTNEDFVQDKDFRDWVLSPNEILNSFWKKFQENNPEKSESIELARQIVKALFFEERRIEKEEYRDSLDYLKSYLIEKSKRKNVISSLATSWGKIAAVLLVSLLIASIYLFVNNNLDHAPGQFVQYIVPEGQKSNLVLADGTKVWLNSGSTLIISTGDPQNVRKCQLKGEAYFDVTKNKKMPFLVETKDYTVKVYGTKFNVCAYDYLNKSETTLKEGSISILTKSEKEIKMIPGEQFLFYSGEKYSMSEVNPDLFMSWKDRILKIDNERLEDLVVRIEHWYGVSVHIDNFERVKDLRYTLTIKTESLKEMFELMNYITPLKYRIDGENVFLKYNSN